MKARIDKARCIGCAVCANICPNGIRMVNGKAEVKNEDAECLKEAATSCPQNAIILDDKESQNNKEKNTNQSYNQYRSMGQGRGIGAGRGRGLGRGPRDGRGRGRGGGGRRR